MNAPRPLPRRRLSGPVRPVLLVLFLLLVVAATAFFLGRARAKNESAFSGNTPENTEQTEKAPEDAADLIQIDGISYLCAADLGEVSGLSASGHFSVKTALGEYDFCVGERDYILNKNTFGFLRAEALERDGKLYLPLTSDREGQREITAVIGEGVSTCAFPANMTPEKYFDALTEKPTFTVDLSEYESCLEPEDRDGYLILANGTHSIGRDYAPKDLVAVERARYDEPYEAKLEKIPAKALDAFLKEAYAQGYNDVTVTSGYRSYSDQEYRFNTKVNSLRDQYPTLEEAQNAAATVIQWPGKSEHQTGLACDMHNLPEADTSFKDEPAAEWLKENAHKFGFILRYPEDKVAATGISFEPWHFRYVGRYHATRMHLLGLVLDDYSEFVSAANTEVKM